MIFSMHTRGLCALMTALRRLWCACVHAIYRIHVLYVYGMLYTYATSRLVRMNVYDDGSSLPLVRMYAD